MHAQKLEIHQEKPFMGRKVGNKKELLERKIGGKTSKIGSVLILIQGLYFYTNMHCSKWLSHNHHCCTPWCIYIFSNLT